MFQNINIEKHNTNIKTTKTNNNMNNEQEIALQHIINKTSIFLTGIPGSGKSYTLKQIIGYAKAASINIGITATTGSSAVLINGKTIHSYLGIGLATKPAETLAKDVLNNKTQKYLVKRLRTLKLLIIDEISMMDAGLFDKISEYLSIIRNNKKPFGDVQLLLCGDLYQLPPINNGFFFQSNIWPTMDMKIVELKQSQRHKSDQLFMNILNELRYGICTNDTLTVLKNTTNNVLDSDIIPTILYTKNVDVDDYNNEQFEKLISAGEIPVTFTTTYSNPPAENWAKSLKIPTEVKLCVGCQVILTMNIDLNAGLCNGSRGVIQEITPLGISVKFMTCNKVIDFYTLTDDEKKENYIKFIPLRLAYALTINKSQGMTLDSAIVHITDYTNKNMMYGRAYTAISRVKNLDSIKIINVTEKSFVAHPDVMAFFKTVE